jgi:hypothetical protein
MIFLKYYFLLIKLLLYKETKKYENKITVVNEFKLKFL